MLAGAGVELAAETLLRVQLEVWVWQAAAKQRLAGGTRISNALHTQCPCLNTLLVVVQPEISAGIPNSWCRPTNVPPAAETLPESLVPAKDEGWFLTVTLTRTKQ